MFPLGTSTAETAKLSDPIALLASSVPGHIQGCMAPTSISFREFVISDPKAPALLYIVWAERGQIVSEKGWRRRKWESVDTVNKGGKLHRILLS